MTRLHAYLCIVLLVLALLAVLGLPGCLFGGGGGGGEESGETPSGETAAPPAEGGGGAPSGEMMGGVPPAGGEAAPAPAEGAAPAQTMGGAPPAQAAAGGGPATGGAAAEALAAKHAGDWKKARAKCQEALAANPNDAEAHRILGWILADTDRAGATEHFNAYLNSGAQGPQAEEVKAALERLATR